MRRYRRQAAQVEMTLPEELLPGKRAVWSGEPRQEVGERWVEGMER